MQIDFIKTSDLKVVNEVMSEVDLVEINKSLNEILITLKKGDKENAQNSTCEIWQAYNEWSLFPRKSNKDFR